MMIVSCYPTNHNYVISIDKRETEQEVFT